MLLTSDRVVSAGHVAVQMVVQVAMTAAEMLPVLALVQVSVVVDGDTIPSLAASDGLSLRRMLQPDVVAAVVQVVVKVAVQVAVGAAEVTVVQVAAISDEMVVSSTSPGGIMPEVTCPLSCGPSPPWQSLQGPWHCDSVYPNLSWLLTPVRNARTRAEDRYKEAHGQTRCIIEMTFGLLKARFRCLHRTGSSLYYSPKKVRQIIVACCMLHNLALRRQVPFLQEDEPGDGLVAAVEPVDSEEDEAEEEDIDNRTNLLMQYFQ
ncbi:hypothetical protein NDU88_005998 [Pleurodeles waltl]|uniref:DDE Tnp4 domain-containing protein n=1 Tax=Pleurodeles waltl TaxID=8319 RepID=A0AAV7SN89_PLEWA|nr:hypothetical protein NDU88_005998 [Pleurodeles waltl]